VEREDNAQTARHRICLFTSIYK